MSVYAFVGAGGKTTLMFDLARAENRPAVVSTTTKVGVDQVVSADECLPLDDFLTKAEGTFSSLTWVSPSLEPINGKIIGTDFCQSEALIRSCRERSLPLFIEADGAARRHLKAPAAHEPVIPAQTDAVFWLCGLDVLGKPLHEDAVFRSEQFSLLTGTALGSALTVESLCRLIRAPEGAFKGTPEGADRIVVLTHASDEAALSAAVVLSRRILKPDGRVSAVWAVSLSEDGHTRILRQWIK